MTVEGIVFDFDGVLFDSIQATLAYYNTVLRAFGAPDVTPAEPEKVFLCHTANSSRVFEVLLGEERRDAAMTYARALNFQQFMPQMRMEPYVVLALQQLRQRMPLALATNRGRDVCDILRYFELDRYFSVVVTCQDVSRPKPDPEMLLLAVTRLGIARERSLYVGDSVLDRRAAEAAAIPFVDYKGAAGGKLKIMNHLQLPLLLERVMAL